MQTENGKSVFYAKTRNEWRKWLQENHQSEPSVWLIIHHKSNPVQSINYEEAVEEAICFGWIDSKANKRDLESYYQYFTRRKPKSNWSISNKVRAEKMIQQGLMTPSGQHTIDVAKEAGTW